MAQNIQIEAKRNGLDRLTIEEIDEKIAAYRREKRSRLQTDSDKGRKMTRGPV